MRCPGRRIDANSRVLVAPTARLDVADRRDHRSDAPVFDRRVTLRDTWQQKDGG